MEYINLHVSVLDSEEFKGSSPTQRSTWLCLLRYLVGQEDGDTITLCAPWSDRKWQQVCAITLAEVKEECALWKWNGDDLVVNFYPHASEKATKSMRRGGRIGNQRLWGKKRTPESPSVSITEPNETKLNSSGAGGGVSEAFPESVSDEVVIAFGESFPGEPASGAPKMPQAWVFEFLKKLNGRREWPRNWQAFMVSCWRTDHRTYQQTGHTPETKKTGASPAQQRFELSQELEGIQARLDAAYETATTPDPGDVAREREIHQLLKNR